MPARWFGRRQPTLDELLRQVSEAIDEAARLRDAGRLDRATETNTRALRMARELDRERALPLLVMALSNQSALAAGAGQRRAALELAEEAVDGAREAYAIRRGEQEAELLAHALAGAADRLVVAGHPREALAYGREALDLRDDQPREDLAGQLETLSRALAALGRHAEALEHTERALSLWRELADESPAGLDFGRALESYANRLHRVGRWDDAVRAGGEAVAFFRAARADRAGLVVMDGLLALTLINHASVLADATRAGDALAAAEEAVTLTRGLVGAHPGHRSALASALKAHGVLLWMHDRPAEARSAVVEAASLYRELDAEERGAYRSALAETLSNVALVHEGEEGLAPAEEAVALHRELVAANAAKLAGLVRALRILADRQTEAGRLDAALAAGQEGLRLVREAPPDDSTFLLRHCANLMREQAERLDRAGRAKEALALGGEAVEVARGFHAGGTADGRAALDLALRAQARRIPLVRGGKNGLKQARALVREADGLRARRR